MICGPLFSSSNSVTVEIVHPRILTWCDTEEIPSWIIACCAYQQFREMNNLADCELLIFLLYPGWKNSFSGFAFCHMVPEFKSGNFWRILLSHLLIERKLVNISNIDKIKKTLSKSLWCQTHGIRTVTVYSPDDSWEEIPYGIVLPAGITCCYSGANEQRGASPKRCHEKTVFDNFSGM